MYLVQVMLTGWLRHKLPDAVVQTALGYFIRAARLAELRIDKAVKKRSRELERS
jgi:hypothetical protein